MVNADSSTGVTEAILRAGDRAHHTHGGFADAFEGDRLCEGQFAHDL